MWKWMATPCQQVNTMSTAKRQEMGKGMGEGGDKAKGDLMWKEVTSCGRGDLMWKGVTSPVQ